MKEDRVARQFGFPESTILKPDIACSGGLSIDCSGAVDRDEKVFGTERYVALRTGDAQLRGGEIRTGNKEVAVRLLTRGVGAEMAHSNGSIEV